MKVKEQMLKQTIVEIGRLIEARYQIYCTRVSGAEEREQRSDHVRSIENQVDRLWVVVRQLKSPYQAA